MASQPGEIPRSLRSLRMTGRGFVSVLALRCTLLGSRACFGWLGVLLVKEPVALVDERLAGLSPPLGQEVGDVDHDGVAKVPKAAEHVTEAWPIDLDKLGALNGLCRQGQDVRLNEGGPAKGFTGADACHDRGVRDAAVRPLKG